MDDSKERRGNSSPSSSLKDILKSSLCLSCFLRKHRSGGHHHHHHRRMSGSSDDDVPGKLTRSFSAKEKSRSRESPMAKSDRRSHFISRLCSHGHRHSSSADFHYDPLSYSRNFDEGYDEGHVDDQLPIRNFSSRLPASPPKTPSSSSNTPREIISTYS